VRRVEIHCDEANQRSAAVPARLGYRLAEVVDHERMTPGETGRRLVWAAERRDWPAPRRVP
jgi:RimJ/RimL family protein N-acetyltransferase